MNKNSLKAEALRLLRAEEKECSTVYPPLDKNKLSHFEERYGITLDDSLKEWLLLSNGSNAAFGGFYGIGWETDYIQISYKVHPYWILSQWVPVAGDGFGNTYLVDCSKNYTRGLVFFIDSYGDASKPSYYVASNFWTFMYMILVKESTYDEDDTEDPWPFNKDLVLSVDPDIIKAPSSLLPWNVD